MSSRIAKILTVAAFAATLAACSSVPLDNNQGTTNGEGQGSATSGQVMDPFNPQSPLAQQRSVYFDFDSYVIPDQYRHLVEMHSKYLAAHTQQKVRIEGNTDARGGADYNLALGQRRSDDVARMMEMLGVNSNQNEARSFGKEKPKALGNTDPDYAANTRKAIR